MYFDQNFGAFCNVKIFLIISVCEDEIPSTCNKTAPLNNCSNIIAFGQSLGVSLQCLCDIEWKNVQENQITQGSCDSTTPGQLKDTCKVSCNTCPTTGKEKL